MLLPRVVSSRNETICVVLMVRGDTTHGINNRLNASKIFFELKCARVMEAEILFCVELVLGQKRLQRTARPLLSELRHTKRELIFMHKKAAQ